MEKPPIQDEIARRNILLKGRGIERCGPCPVCGGDDRFSINIKKQVFNCRGCNLGGDVIAMIRHLDGCDYTTACATAGCEPQPRNSGNGAARPARSRNANASEMERLLTAPPSHPKMISLDTPQEATQAPQEAAGVLQWVCDYPYYNRDGKLLYVVERHEDPKKVLKKTFRQRRPNPNKDGDWIRVGIFEGADAPQRVPYHLPELTAELAADPTARIFIPEGEKDTDSVRSLGLIATTAASGVWTPDMASVFKDRDVIVLEDHDKPGREKAHKVAMVLHGIAETVRIAGFEDIPKEGADVSDWIALNPAHHNAAALVERCKHAPLFDPDAELKAKHPDPFDLWGQFEPPTLPRGLLPDLIERFAFDQGMDIGADMAGLAMAALAVCAAATPDKVKLQVKKHNAGWLESARLWVALIGLPSTKKSPIMRAALWPFRKLDTELARMHSDEQAIYDGLSKEEKAHTQPPKNTRLLLQDTTIEAAQEVLKDSPNGVLCSHDELSGWFGAMDRYTSGRGAGAARAFWLEAYNGGPHSVNRINRGALHIPNLSASLLGGIQPELIRKIAADSTDDGLLQRVLPIVLKQAVISQDEPTSDIVREYAELIGWLRHLGEMTVHFDDGAQRYRRELEQRYLDLQAIEAVNPKLSAHLGKYDGIFARLCLLWHCIESRYSSLPPVIPEKTARRVGAFMHDFLLPHATSNIPKKPTTASAIG